VLDLHSVPDSNGSPTHNSIHAVPGKVGGLGRQRELPQSNQWWVSMQDNMGRASRKVVDK
jgi:hypothetical protein